VYSYTTLIIERGTSLSDAGGSTPSETGSVPRPAFASLRVRLLLLVLLATVPALGLTVYSGLKHRRIAAVRTQEEALRLAELASNNHQRLIEGARQLLLALAHALPVQKRDARACSALLATLLKQVPLYAILGASEPDGRIFCSGLPLTAPVNNADRAYFQRAMATRDFAIGDYQVGRISGKATVSFGYPVVDEAGQVRALVFAALDLNWLNQLVGEGRLPPGWTLTVIDRHGTILTRHPHPDQWVGKSVPETPLVRAILPRRRGTAEAAGLDGVPRFYGFAPLHNTPGIGDVYVSIGVPTEVAMTEINRMHVGKLIALGLIGALALGLAWVGSDLLLVRRVKGLVRAATRLGAGELSTRVASTWDGELGELATEFNAMAGRLEIAHDQLAQHIKALERRQQEVGLLREIDQKLLAQVSLLDLVQAAVEAFAQFAGAPWCVLVTADRETGALTPAAIVAADAETVRRYYAALQPRGADSAAGIAIATREATWSADLALDPRWEGIREPLLAQGVRAVLAVPLLTPSQALGAVSLGYAEARTFTEAEVQELQGFGNQLAVAIEHARLQEAAAERWRMEELNRIRALFVANMSHELRTPLNAVIGFAELLERAAAGPLLEEQQRWVGSILSSGKHLLALINDLLDISKVEAGKIELRLERLLVGDAVDAAVSLVRVQAIRKQLVLKIELEIQALQITADPVRLKQILFNLLSNAVKYTPNGGTVTVSVRRGDREFAEIAVRDTGIGIRTEDLGKLFREFVRLQSSVTSGVEGTGLGLALTKRLVELHGGTIWATSEGEGKGATFTVRLPIGHVAA
jgi:signal transduction histidine kinase/HAMP domain-containing protein